MAHWCLRDINYDTLDFLAKPAPLEQVHQKLRSRTSSTSSVGSDDHGSWNPATGDSPARDHTAQGTPARAAANAGVGGRVPSPGVVVGVSAPEDGMWAEEHLRETVVSRDKQHEIPLIVSEWPCKVLRLSRVVSPEACERVFDSMGQLWTRFLHGLLLLRPQSKLQVLDFREFVPNKEMMYTMLQLVPLLCMPGQLCKRELLHSIVTKYGLKDHGLIQNLSNFLDNILRHPVFQRGKKISLPVNRLDILLDFVPLSADRLGFLCWMLASSIQDSSRVFITPSTIVFTYAHPGVELSPMEPLLPLEAVATHCQNNRDLKGLAAHNLPTLSWVVLTESLLPRILQASPDLVKLAITFSNLDLMTSQTFARSVTSQVARCSRLKRLDLSGSKLAGCMGALFRALCQPLEFLNLSYCCLDLDDVDSLFKSGHCRGLRDLNMSQIYSPQCEECRKNPPSPFKSDDNYRHPAPDNSVSNPSGSDPEDDEEYDNVISSPRGGGDSWHFWSTQRSITSPTPGQCVSTHSHDRILVKHVLANVHACSELVLLDFNCDKFGRFRIDSDTLEGLCSAVGHLASLKSLRVEDFPLWDDDLFQLVHTASGLPDLHVIAMSRSPEAPTMQTQDKILFWKRMYKARRGKLIRTSIANFLDEAYYSLTTDSEDFSRESFSSFATPATPGTPQSPRSPRLPHSPFHPQSPVTPRSPVPPHSPFHTHSPVTPRSPRSPLTSRSSRFH